MSCEINPRWNVPHRGRGNAKKWFRDTGGGLELDSKAPRGFCVELELHQRVHVWSHRGEWPQTSCCSFVFIPRRWPGMKAWLVATNPRWSLQATSTPRTNHCGIRRPSSNTLQNPPTPHPLIPILYVPWVGEGCIACKRITVIWLLNGEYNILDTVSFGQIIISSLLVFAEIAWRKKSTSEITDVAHFTCWNSHKRKRGLRGAYHMEAAAPGTLLFPDSLQHISCLSQLERWKLTCSENPVIYWFQWLLSRNYSYKWFTVML